MFADTNRFDEVTANVAVFFDVLGCGFLVLCPEACPPCTLRGGDFAARCNGERPSLARNAGYLAFSCGLLSDTGPTRSLRLCHAAPRSGGHYTRGLPAIASKSRAPSNNSFDCRDRFVQCFNLLLGLFALFPELLECALQIRHVPP